MFARDELQALLQPTTTDSGLQDHLAWGEVAFICDGVLRWILINTPPHVLWAVKGSNMVLVWMSLEAVPVNGTAPLNQIKTVHLPASVPPHLMQELEVHSLQQLGLSQPQLQELEQAVGQAEHRGRGTIEDAARAAVTEWKLALAHMSDEDRRQVLDLANGCWAPRSSTFRTGVSGSSWSRTC
eukprot:XP_001694839.1 predicted protein [Chlamydomonas reinhardtii]